MAAAPGNATAAEADDVSGAGNTAADDGDGDGDLCGPVASDGDEVAAVPVSSGRSDRAIASADPAGVTGSGATDVVRFEVAGSVAMRLAA